MAWTVLNPFVAYQRLTAAVMEQVRVNQNHLKNLPYQVNAITKGSNITTSSTTWVVTDSPLFVVNVTPTITTGTCSIDVWGTFPLRCSGDATVRRTYFRLDMNGTPVTVSAGPMMSFEGNSSQVYQATFFWRVVNCTPGLKTFNLAWQVSGGTATIFSNTADARYAEGQFGAKES